MRELPTDIREKRMNDRPSRREFMGLTATGVAGMAGLVTPSWLRGAGTLLSAPPEPDLVVHNARVYTMNPAAPRAEAFAIKGGRFVAVGSSAMVKALATRRTETLDAKGMTIVPG